MSTLNQDNITREKLQELKDAPVAFSFDASNVWQKMESELNKSMQKKNHFTWIRVAASLLLIFLTAVFYHPPKKLIAPVTVTKTKVQPFVPTYIHQPSLNTSTEQPTATQMVSKLISAKKEATVLDSVIYQRPSNTNVELHVAANIIPQPLISTQPDMTPIKKPRLKVVHINDLYKQEPEEIAKAEIKKQLNEEPNTETAPVPSTPSKPFWKTKTTQKVVISLNDNQ